MLSKHVIRCTKKFYTLWDKMGRIIVYGDIHGCLDEFIKLREKISVKKGDIEIATGDMINKGPSSKEVLKYMIHEKIQAVIGNNEEKLIRFHYHKAKRDVLSNPVELSNGSKKVYESLFKEQIEYLQKLPVYRRFGKLTVLHGGVNNRIRLDKLNRHEREHVIHMRWIDKNYCYIPQDSKRKKAYFWAEAYDGREGYVVYGHQVFSKPRRDSYALGIDTGCVYGHKLTCAIFSEKNGEADIKSLETVSFNAKKKYDYKIIKHPDKI